MSQSEVFVKIDINEKQYPIEKKTFFCTLCAYSSDYRSNVTLHQANVHNKRTGILECCDIRFSDKAAYKQHLQQIHPQRFLN